MHKNVFLSLHFAETVKRPRNLKTNQKDVGRKYCDDSSHYHSGPK